jgi:hypothetical protein
MKIAKWIIAGIISYGATFWIKNIVWNVIAGIAVWYGSLYFIDRFLEGEI